MKDVSGLVNRFYEALVSLDRVAAAKIMETTPCSPAYDFVDQIIVPALERVGDDWEQGRVAMSQVYISGKICEDLAASVLPLAGFPRRNQPKLAVTVLSDFHMLGKQIVCSVLLASRYEILDYGRQEIAPLVERVQKDHIEILLISTLMLPSALQVRDVRMQLDAAGCPAKVIVGGAPFRIDTMLWKDVGADAMCRTAGEAPKTIEWIAQGQYIHI